MPTGGEVPQEEGNEPSEMRRKVVRAQVKEVIEQQPRAIMPPLETAAALPSTPRSE